MSSITLRDYRMLKKVGELLMETYGYELASIITPVKTKHNALFSSGPVCIALIDDVEKAMVIMQIIENEHTLAYAIPYDREDYQDVVLNALLTFAVERCVPST